MKSSALIIVLVIGVLTSCKNKAKTIPAEEMVKTDTLVVLPPPPPVEDSIFLTHARTPCFGMCPVYELKVYKSGKAIFEGKNFTDRIGTYQSQWDETALHRIEEIADSIGYFSFDDAYDNQHVTDLPTKKTSILRNGKLKPVADRYKAPKTLQRLYEELDRQIEKANWKPIEGRQ